MLPKQMNFKEMKYYILAILFFSQLVFSQQEKTFNHTISKGETLYQIAKKYNVTEADIIRLNPGAEIGIQENTTLIIPNNNSMSYLFKKNDVQAVNYAKHQVTAKETLFSIARQYNVSVKDLDELNGDALKDGLKIGQEILLPNKKKTISGQVRVINNETQFHEVQPKETKYSISKKYGITIEQLEMQNPEIINGLVVGTKLAINKNAIKAKNENEELMIALAEKQAEIEKSKAQKAKIEDLEDRLKVQKELNKKMITLNKLNINLNAIDESKTGSVEKLKLIIDANRKIQDVLLAKFDSLALKMEDDLVKLKATDLETYEASKKMEADSNEKMKETNKLILQLKQDLAENRKIFTAALQKIQRINIQENQELKKKVRENINNKDVTTQDEIEELNFIQNMNEKHQDEIVAKVESLENEKKTELKRRISKASFYSSEAREFDDKLALAKLERVQNSIEVETPKSTTTTNRDLKIETITNLSDLKDGFYLVTHIITDANERDEMTKKLSYSGEKGTKFFYNVNNFGYYIYTNYFETLSQATFECKVKPNIDLYKNLFLVQIKKQ